MRDPYEVLELARGAGPDEIKSAFRRLAKIHHPDANPGDDTAETRFKEINEAYQALTNSAPSQNQQYHEADDLFQREIFRHFQRQHEEVHRRTANPDVLSRVEIGLEDVLKGTEIELQLASGETLKLNLPKGIETGQRFRVQGAGMQRDARWPAGDLYVEITVRNHERFRRINAGALAIDVEIDSLSAILGGETEIITLDGDTVIVPYPKGTQNGQKVSVPGKGLPYRGLAETNPPTFHKGDLYVIFQLVTPTILTERHVELVNELRKILPSENPPT